jgi:hypothetical protein
MTKQEGKTYFYVETKQEARRRTISIWQEEIDDESLVQEGKKNEYGTQIFNKHRSKNIDLKTHVVVGLVVIANYSRKKKIGCGGVDLEGLRCGFGDVNLERKKF